MSLTWTTVRCNDGKWYRNPVWRGSDNGERFFLCFDDDDPPELIIEKHHDYQLGDAVIKAERILENLKIRADINLKSYDPVALRVFEKHTLNFAPSFRFFIEILDAPPPPTEYTKVTDEPPDSGCLFPYGAMS